MNRFQPDYERSVRLELMTPDRLYPRDPDSDVKIVPRIEPDEAYLEYLLQATDLNNSLRSPQNGQTEPRSTELAGQEASKSAETQLAIIYMSGVKKLISDVSESFGAKGEIRMVVDRVYPNTPKPVDKMAKLYAKAALDKCGIRVYWAPLGEENATTAELLVDWSGASFAGSR